jgi:predicted GNAT family N-acyltransferase
MENTVYTESHISVSDYSMDSQGIHGVCAEADLVDGKWWISRVLVKKEQDRGNGLGSKFLQKLLYEIYLRDPDATVIVCPGGYVSDMERQISFYKKNDFVAVSDDNFGDFLQHKKG